MHTQLWSQSHKQPTTLYYMHDHISIIVTSYLYRSDGMNLRKNSPIPHLNCTPEEANDSMQRVIKVWQRQLYHIAVNLRSLDLQELRLSAQFKNKGHFMTSVEKWFVYEYDTTGKVSAMKKLVKSRMYHSSTWYVYMFSHFELCTSNGYVASQIHNYFSCAHNTASQQSPVSCGSFTLGYSITKIM